MPKKRPTYKEKGKIYHADASDPLIEAANNGLLKIDAIGRGSYPGKPIPDNVLPEIRSIGVWNAERDQNLEMDWHRNEGIEISFLENGFMNFAVEGKDYDLKPGKMTITRPWQPHRIGNPNVSGCRLHWLILDVGVRQPHQDWTWPDWMVITERDLRELTTSLRENEYPVWTASAIIQDTFIKIGKTIAKDDDITNIASRLSVQINELFLLMLDMFRAQKIPLTRGLTSARRSTEMFLKALPDSLAEEWTLETMAQASGLGVTRFVHYCKQITNKTPIDYLNRLRVRRAAVLLKGSKNKSITDIAFECGFSSSQYFATVFRRHYKCTPRQYKTQN